MLLGLVRGPDEGKAESGVGAERTRGRGLVVYERRRDGFGQLEIARGLVEHIVQRRPAGHDPTQRLLVVLRDTVGEETPQRLTSTRESRQHIPLDDPGRQVVQQFADLGGAHGIFGHVCLSSLHDLREVIVAADEPKECRISQT